MPQRDSKRSQTVALASRDSSVPRIWDSPGTQRLGAVCAIPDVPRRNRTPAANRMHDTHGRGSGRDATTLTPTRSTTTHSQSRDTLAATRTRTSDMSIAQARSKCPTYRWLLHPPHKKKTPPPAEKLGVTGGRLGCSVKLRNSYVFHLGRTGFVNRRYTPQKKHSARMKEIINNNSAILNMRSTLI